MLLAKKRSNRVTHAKDAILAKTNKFLKSNESEEFQT